jgi:hypothetical protein
MHVQKKITDEFSPKCQLTTSMRTGREVKYRMKKNKQVYKRSILLKMKLCFSTNKLHKTNHRKLKEVFVFLKQANYMELKNESTISGIFIIQIQIFKL